MQHALALGDYFESHLMRAYASGISPAVRAAKAILSKLNQRKLEPQFTAREVYRAGWAGLADRELVEHALDMLATHGHLVESLVATGGRPLTRYASVEMTAWTEGRAVLT